ncbi:MAG TPA: GNAT family N-acetyltransferase [Candidatus Nanoarchaeia archaeon]|nr:GNAT family N-acetyltransferase [Candidatus Nanoarchaeia archaeon]
MVTTDVVLATRALLMRHFPLYYDWHAVSAVIDNDKLTLKYEGDGVDIPFNNTSFELRLYKNSLAQIHHFAIEPAERRKQNGTKLYRVLEDLLHALDYTVVELKAPDAEAQKFWTSIGFRNKYGQGSSFIKNI